jgi:hypothetical protein
LVDISDPPLTEADVMRAPLPADEAARLTSLHGYEILDTPPEQVFEDLVRLASTVSGMPVALISLVDAERQWFKARLEQIPDPLGASVAGRRCAVVWRRETPWRELTRLSCGIGCCGPARGVG